VGKNEMERSGVFVETLRYFVACFATFRMMLFISFQVQGLEVFPSCPFISTQQSAQPFKGGISLYVPSEFAVKVRILTASSFFCIYMIITINGAYYDERRFIAMNGDYYDERRFIAMNGDYYDERRLLR